MIIRALLLLALAAIGFFVFLRRNKLPFHIMIMFVMLGVGATAILAPEETLDDIALAFGVGRGVDLIMYLVDVATIFVLLHYFTKFVDLQRQVTELTREMAIMKAEAEQQAKPVVTPRDTGDRPSA
jgi:small membrane protein